MILPVNGLAQNAFLYKVPRAAGYKRRAIWLGPLPLPDLMGLTPWQIWQLGIVHVIIGASSIGHTRLRIEPPMSVSGDVVGLVLSYVGHQEAVYETWAAAERSNGPYPAAVNLLFCGSPLSEGREENPMTISLERFSAKQAEFIQEMQLSCVPPLFHGVPGCGKTETLVAQMNCPEKQVRNHTIACLRHTRRERDEIDVALHDRGYSDDVLSLGAPAAGNTSQDMRSQARVRAKVRELAVQR